MQNAAIMCDMLDDEINFLRKQLHTDATRDIGVLLLARDYFAAKVETLRVEPVPITLPKPAVSAPEGITLEDVRSAVIQAHKRTSASTVQRVVMGHGGKTPKPEGGEGPSLVALPPEQYAACIAAVEALPTTR